MHMSEKWYLSLSQGVESIKVLEPFIIIIIIFFNFILFLNFT